MKRTAELLVSPKFLLHYCAITDPGCKRSHNEDDYLVDANRFLFAVADGVGGLSGGEIASSMALAQCREQFKSLEKNFWETTSSRILKAIDFANKAVFRYGTEKNRRIATTLSLVVIKGLQAYIANVGDSRLYRLRQNQLCQLTSDHTVRQEMIANGVLANNSSSPSISNVITRAIGAESKVQIDITRHTIKHDDVYLLCTDGITSMLLEHEIQATLESSEGVEKAGDTLLEKAKAAGGGDNITLVLLAFSDKR